MTRPAIQQRGFTLVELLIAIAVFAVMAAIAYGGLSSVIASRDSVDAALDRSKDLQMALWRIQQDIEQTVDRPARDAFGDRQPAIFGSPDIGLYVTRAGWSNPLGEDRSTLERVHYQLDNDSHLVRGYYRVLDLAQDSDPVEADLLDNVISLEWRFLDDNGQWQDRWPPDANSARYAGDTSATGLPDTTTSDTTGDTNTRTGNGPPMAVELTLDTRTWGRLRLLFMIAGSRL